MELAEEVVARLGYEPVGFVSSTAALQAFLAEPQRFDAVITDEMMPDLVGDGARAANPRACGRRFRSS